MMPKVKPSKQDRLIERQQRNLDAKITVQVLTQGYRFIRPGTAPLVAFADYERRKA